MRVTAHKSDVNTWSYLYLRQKKIRKLPLMYWLNTQLFTLLLWQHVKSSGVIPTHDLAFFPLIPNDQVHEPLVINVNMIPISTDPMHLWKHRLVAVLYFHLYWWNASRYRNQQHLQMLYNHMPCLTIHMTHHLPGDSLHSSRSMVGIKLLFDCGQCSLKHSILNVSM